MNIDDRTEWIEADGLGGFASGTTSGIRTRRYHALLLAATTPPTGRMVLVNGADVWIDSPAGSFALSTQRYAPDVLYPDGSSRIESFALEPWPTWTYRLPDGARISQEIFVPRGAATTCLTWRVIEGTRPVTLRVRPFLSGRDYHSMHHENGAFQFSATPADAVVCFRSYEGVPAVIALSNGSYHHGPDWYRRFLYTAERERCLDDIEDLASPGEFVWRIGGSEDRAVLMLRGDGSDPPRALTRDDVTSIVADAEASERARRAAFPSALDRAADIYLVERGRGRTIVAGYPWFTDWGRDTLISIRGLCLATGRLAEARDILLEWAGAVSEGMLPNRFPDHGDEPEFNAVDASLWFVIAAHELLERATRVGRRGTAKLLTPTQIAALEMAIRQIVSGYARGTRFGIRLDDDGLLAAGVPGVQLTWMDARVGDRVITPRIGKPVEIQALWLNAVAIAARLEPSWTSGFERGRASFAERFWNPERRHLADVVDVDHVAGTRDDAFRPNQILAIGGLPYDLIDATRARLVVDAVEARLLTPLGLRSLAPGEPDYAARYEGNGAERDAVYHQGTVWPWLIGPFVDAWVRVRGNTAAARDEARARFMTPLIAHLQTAGLGHISEIADAEAPFTPRGCPFQAWSLGEFLRLDRSVLANATTTSQSRQRASQPA